VVGNSMKHLFGWTFRIARIGTSLCLASWLIFLPLGQFLHLTYASHEHRYCPIHNRLEDVHKPINAPKRADNGNHAISEDGDDAEHVPCGILNATVSTPSLYERNDAGRIPAQSPTARFATYKQPLFSAATLILTAPKHSPPAISC
jgi:hypothetical protein